MSNTEVTQAMLRKAATVAGYDWYPKGGGGGVKFG